MAGPLAGIRILEFAGIGPAPFCGMMLADHGAELVRIERPGAAVSPLDPLLRSRQSIAIDLRRPEGAAIARDLARRSDGLIEGFRAGVMERLGLGPDVLLKVNPKLVFGRMTGWGQDGPLAKAAGHDINYIALSGALHACGRTDKPTPPVNYLGDFGGGGMLLAFGMTAALLGVRNGAPGQVIDCAMVDGSALLTAMTWGLKAMGRWRDEREANVIDGGAHFYDVYETRDRKWIAIGSIEPQFYALLREKLGLAGESFDAQFDAKAWPVLKAEIAAIVKTRTRAEWSALLEGSDVCYAPVLSFEEAPGHPHNAARGTFIQVAGAMQPAPAPRYSRTPTAAPRQPREASADADAILAALGKSEADIAALKAEGIVG